mgnify:CR=1 FL=1
MYKIYIVNTPYVKDRILIYDDDVYDESLRLSDPKLHLEVNSAGTLEFSIAPDNVGYEKIVPMKTQFIVVRSDSPEKNGTRQRNEIIWFGRALTVDTDIYKVKSIHCEGALSYLNDVVYRDNSGGIFWNASQPVGALLYSAWNDIQGDGTHHKVMINDVVSYVYHHATEGTYDLPNTPLRLPGVVFEANNQFKTKYWGLEPIVSNDQASQDFFFDQASLSQTNYANTSGILNPDDMTMLDLVTGLLDAVNGYYWVSLVETDAPNGLDRIYGMQLHLARTLKEPNENYPSQTIRFGENLTDYTENEDGSSFWTAVHPYGTFEGRDRSSTLTGDQLGAKGTTPIKKLNWHVENTSTAVPSIIIVDDLVKEYGMIIKDLDVGTLTMREQLIGMSINTIDSLNIVERKSGSNSWTSALRYVTITGVDMTFMGADYNMIDLMDSVHIISEPHGVDTYLNVTSIDVDLQRPENSVYVLNGTLERNMAESKGYSGSSSGSSSGSGGGYTHPRYTEHALGMYKVANDSLGHISSVDKVTKEDLFALGVPSRNTTYDLTKKDGKIILRSDLGNEYPVTDDDTKYTLLKSGDTIKMEGTDGSISEVEVSGGTDTTYSLSKTGDKITLIGSDGSSSSVVDSDTTYAFVQYATLHTDYASHPPSVVLRDSAGEHTEIIVPNAGTCVMGWNPLYNEGYGDLQNTDKYASIGDILFAKSDDWVSGSCDIHAHFYMKYDTLQYGFDIYIWSTPGGSNRAEIFVPSVLSPQNIKWTVLYTVPGVNEGFEKRSVVYRICVDQESMKKIQDVNGSVFIDYQTGFKGGALEPVTKTNAVDAYLKKYHYDSVVRTDVILSSQNASDVAFTGDYNDLSNKPTIPDISGKQDKSTAVTHTANTAVGSATKPVYIAANGAATPISHSINADVPANAKFTDTTYNDATQSAHGLMTAADKKKLDGMDLSKYLPLSGGMMTGDIDMATNKKDILIGTQKANTNNGTAVVGGTINTDKKFVDLLPTMRSYIGTYQYKTSSTEQWFDLISVRHRNGYGDGSSWGMTIYAPSFGGDLHWNLNTNKDVWQGERVLLDSVNFTSYALAKDGTAKKAELLSNGQMRSAYGHNDDATFSNGYVWFKIGTAVASGGYATITTTFLGICGYGKHALYTARIRLTSAGNAVESISFLESGRTGGMLTGLFRIVAINGEKNVTFELWAKVASRWEGTRVVILNEMNLAGGNQSNFWTLTSRGNADAKTAPTTGNMHVDSSDSSICATAATAQTLSDSGWSTVTTYAVDTTKFTNISTSFRLIGQIAWVNCSFTPKNNMTNFTVCDLTKIDPFIAITPTVSVNGIGSNTAGTEFFRANISYGGDHKLYVDGNFKANTAYRLMFSYPKT